MNFSDRVKELRKNKNLSQSKLGEMVGIHYTQVGRYEKGESFPSMEILRKLADALEVSTDYLMEGSSGEVALAHIHDRELLHQFKQVQEMEERDQEMIKTFIDALITKRQIQKMAR